MLKKNEIYRTVVSGFTSEGLGVCRVDGCAVFVPNAAPDEEYDLRITHVGRHAAYGRIERILTASPDRCTRLCRMPSAAAAAISGTCAIRRSAASRRSA